MAGQDSRVGLGRIQDPVAGEFETPIPVRRETADARCRQTMHVDVGRIQLVGRSPSGPYFKRNLFETFVVQFLLRMYQRYKAFRGRHCKVAASVFSWVRLWANGSANKASRNNEPRDRMVKPSGLLASTRTKSA